LFLHGNASSHRTLATHKKLAYLRFQFLDHAPCSPEFTPSDYHLFPELKKKQFKIRRFSSDIEVIAAAEPWLDGQTLKCFEWLGNVRATG
jgi:hypothetical protein